MRLRLPVALGARVPQSGRSRPFAFKSCRRTVANERSRTVVKCRDRSPSKVVLIHVRLRLPVALCARVPERVRPRQLRRRWEVPEALPANILLKRGVALQWVVGDSWLTNPRPLLACQVALTKLTTLKGAGIFSWGSEPCAENNVRGRESLLRSGFEGSGVGNRPPTAALSALGYSRSAARQCPAEKGGYKVYSQIRTHTSPGSYRGTSPIR